jgi:hypothetical protein
MLTKHKIVCSSDTHAPYSNAPHSCCIPEGTHHNLIQAADTIHSNVSSKTTATASSRDTGQQQRQHAVCLHGKGTRSLEKCSQDSQYKSRPHSITHTQQAATTGEAAMHSGLRALNTACANHCLSSWQHCSARATQCQESPPWAAAPGSPGSTTHTHTHTHTQTSMHTAAGCHTRGPMMHTAQSTACCTGPAWRQPRNYASAPAADGRTHTASRKHHAKRAMLLAAAAPTAQCSTTDPHRNCCALSSRQRDNTRATSKEPQNPGQST